MTDNITGSSNVAVGSDALDENTGGSFNVGIGDGAGRNNKTGNNNTFLGYNTDISGNVVYNNSTAIGTGAIIDASNCIVIGTASETVKIRGGLTVTGGITGTASNVNVSELGTNASFSVPFLSAATGSATIFSDPGIRYNPSTNLLQTTATNVMINASSTNTAYRIPFALDATGSTTLLSDSNLNFNPSSNTFSVDNASVDNISVDKITANSLNVGAGVWLIDGTNTGSLNAIVPLFTSQSDLGDINNQSALTFTKQDTTEGAAGDFQDPFNNDNKIDIIIVFPKWGIVGFNGTGYSSTMNINYKNTNAFPVFVDPLDNVMSSCKIYYNDVEQ